MIRIYGYDDCTYCQQAKQLLRNEGLEYEFTSVGETREERSAWLDSQGITGADRTFPRVFTVNHTGHENLIGGFSDLEYFVLFETA